MVLTLQKGVAMDLRGKPVEKLILLPQGPVAELHRPARRDPNYVSPQTQFEEMLTHCGGDLNRVFDQKFDDIQALIKHLTRSNRIESDGQRLFSRPTLVGLTQSFPLSSSISLRNELCRALPDLERALWVLYLDLETDPSFPEIALKNGEFMELDIKREDTDGRVRVLEIIDRCPYWRDKQGRRYLVLLRGLLNAEMIAKRAENLFNLVQNNDGEPITKTRQRSSGLSQTFRTNGSKTQGS